MHHPNLVNLMMTRGSCFIYEFMPMDSPENHICGKVKLKYKGNSDEDGFGTVSSDSYYNALSVEGIRMTQLRSSVSAKEAVTSPNGIARTTSYFKTVIVLESSSLSFLGILNRLR
ncbi:hypothetical protein BUALT_Bualt02G0020900 [Buddleja alternifolia]|uniref:Serine-threonine/tyrosine-protein kinase catalytic domain-containing protein n=1 Tax=Buddleja alternifolia TaxID=168488 RepID=A0AAV6XYU8_9LAMI|nr:hypothetical protein BUALT_Bualt02G0020900 [Buddleja alternifolia]